MNKKESLNPNWIVSIDYNIETVKVDQEIEKIPGKLTYEELEEGGVLVKLTTDIFDGIKKDHKRDV